MQLQTNIPLSPQQHNQIDYNSQLLLVGSCFTENIGDKLKYFKFQNSVNPFGIVFHPRAIEKLITYSSNEKEFSEDDLFFLNEQWHSFDAHSKLSNTDKQQLLADLNTAVRSTIQQIKDSTHIIITLGSAWVYRHIESDKIVANCHKVPQKKFLKEILPVDTITESLEAIISLIRIMNSKAVVIFTVSPVRHLKDGFVENSSSKAHLISAVYEVTEPRKSIYYFPAYEIVMDELRDYRFYADDMIHPNQTAIDYIWQKFQHVWISEEASQTMNDVDSIQKGLNHKPFNPSSEQHIKFRSSLNKKMEALLQAFPFMKF